MKKTVSVFILLVLSLSLVLANVSPLSYHNSTPMSTQEMNIIIGGNNTDCYCDGTRGCCTLDVWIFEVTVCVNTYGSVCRE
jgi:hypothetical protein